MECDANKVEWASINLGIFLCESCSGRHRNLGAHISKVRSLKLDTKIWTKSVIQDMKLKGNMNAKSYFESRVPLYSIKPPNDIGPIVVEDWIRSKYDKKLFIDPNKPNNIYSQNNNSSRQNNKNLALDDLKIDSQQSLNMSANLNYAIHKMPCTPTHAMMKWIQPTDDKHITKQQFIILHGRFLSRYSGPHSQKCEQMIDITKQPVWISKSSTNQPCILAIGPEKMDEGMRFEFDEYKDIKYWTQLIRRSALFYQQLGILLADFLLVFGLTNKCKDVWYMINDI